MNIRKPAVQLNANTLEFNFARSSGAGGQNVNKVESQVILRWHFLNDPLLSESRKELLARKLAKFMDSEGTVVIRSQVHRKQGDNRRECIEKLKALIAKALIPEKVRKPTAPTAASRRRRLQAKKLHSEKKKLRKL